MSIIIAAIKKPAVWLLLAAAYAGILFACQSKPALADGKSAPDFNLPDGLGSTISLSSLQGSVVLLDFWDTGCSPCKEELPDFQNFYNQFGKSGLKVVVISVGDSLQGATQYIQGKGYTFTSLVDTQKVIENSYAASNLPASVLIDVNGKVVDSWTGLADDDLVLSRQIEKLLPAQRSAAQLPQKATPTAAPSRQLTFTSAVSVTETPLPQPSSYSFAAPQSIAPDDTAAFDNGAFARLAWQWHGALNDDEYFEVFFWQDGQAPTALGHTKGTFELFLGSPDTAYSWAVRVVRMTGQQLEPLSPLSSTQHISWGK